MDGVAFIGLGVMGYRMAGHLARAAGASNSRAALPRRATRPALRGSKPPEGMLIATGPDPAASSKKEFQYTARLRANQPLRPC